MESTGKAGAIQVTEETCHILQMFGYTFEQRGLVAVKGKGQLMTYYLIGKSDKPPPSTPINVNTVRTEDVNKNSPKLMAPESPNPQTLSSATASPSSVRLNQNYQPNAAAENLESLGSNEENIGDPLLKASSSSSPKTHATTAINNHFNNDENEALLDDDAV
jgi:Adenylate and Guanylate cyclase catalytic domain